MKSIIRSSEEAKKELKNIEKCFTQTDAFMVKCIPYMLAKFEKIEKNTELIVLELSKQRKKKKKRSAYQQHLSDEMKAGSTMGEAQRSWKVDSPW